MRKIIIIGCLLMASFFVACNQEQAEEKEQAAREQSSAEFEMYEASELAGLMRKMYEDNVELGKQIEAGKLPESFPEDFYTIHKAQATEGMKKDTAFYNRMADQYLANMKKITEAGNKQEAKIAYNEMVMTCASCHQVYCQGPLGKIKRMKLSMNETKAGTN